MNELLMHYSPSNLVAYLDGGTGSMLLQAAVAGLLSAAFIAKTKWAQFKAMISKAPREDATSK